MHDSHIRYSAMMVVRAMRDCAGRDMLYRSRVKSYRRLATQWEAGRWLRHSPHSAWCLEALGWDLTGAELAEMCKNGNLNWGRIGHYLGELLKRT